jgi:hypothetical protein
LIDYRSIAVECISGTVAGFARPRRAVKPNAAWRRAEGAGLTAKARTEQSSMSPQYASSSDTVREIKYQILHLNPLGISNLAARLAPSVGCAT